MKAMSDSIKIDIVKCLIGVVLGAATALVVKDCCGKRWPPKGDPQTHVQVDSVKTQVDTTTAVAPDPSETRRDTVYIRVPVSGPKLPGNVPKLPESVPEFPETVPEFPESVPELPDSTIYIPLILEQKVYEDSTYRAVVSGPAIDQYGPQLDSISVYRKTVTVYQTQTVYVEQKPRSRYDFLRVDARLVYDGVPRAPITVNLGYRRGPFEVYGGGGYDPLQKRAVGQVGVNVTIQMKR